MYEFTCWSHVSLKEKHWDARRANHSKEYRDKDNAIFLEKHWVKDFATVLKKHWNKDTACRVKKYKDKHDAKI